MPTRVNSVKAADPGLGFTLNFDQALNNSLKVAITMTDLQTQQLYKSEVSLHDPISDQELVFVVPFGDNAYAPSNCLKFQIDLYTPYDNNNSLTPPLTGVVMGENGVFNFSTSVPTVVHDFPKTGDMLQSEDGAFIGIYQKDGNFCVYPQFADNQSDFNKVYSSHSDIGQPTMFFPNKLNDGTPYFTICTPDFSKNASQSNFLSAYEYKAFSINSAGSLCFNDFPISFTKI